MSTFPHLSLTFPNWKPHLLAVTLSPHRSHRHQIVAPYQISVWCNYLLLMTTTLTHKRTKGKMRMWLITGRVILVQNGTYMIHLPPFGSLGMPLENEWILNPMLHLEGNSKGSKMTWPTETILSRNEGTMPPLFLFQCSGISFNDHP